MGWRILVSCRHRCYGPTLESLPDNKELSEKPGIYNFILVHYVRLGRDSSVGIATRYGLDGQGIESRWGERFSAPVQTGPGACPSSCTMGTGSFPGVRRPGRGADHPPPSKCRGQERVGLYLYSTLWAFVACYREHLYLYLYITFAAF